MHQTTTILIFTKGKYIDSHLFPFRCVLLTPYPNPLSFIWISSTNLKNIWLPSVILWLFPSAPLLLQRCTISLWTGILQLAHESLWTETDGLLSYIRRTHIHNHDTDTVADWQRKHQQSFRISSTSLRKQNCNSFPPWKCTLWCHKIHDFFFPEDWLHLERENKLVAWHCVCYSPTL